MSRKLLFPFQNKITIDGKKIFRRVHGLSESMSQGVNDITFSIPYNECKITEVQIVDAIKGDKADFEVYDDALGTYTTVSNYKLNQFGYEVNVSENFFHDESPYDADLFLGMVLKVTITRAQNVTSDIGINFILHEIKL